jgi:hypothetical protein
VKTRFAGGAVSFRTAAKIIFHGDKAVLRQTYSIEGVGTSYDLQRRAVKEWIFWSVHDFSPFFYPFVISSIILARLRFPSNSAL